MIDRGSLMNGKKIDDLKGSYVFTYLFESTISDFYNLDGEGKKRLAERYDKDFSEFFNMPRANIIFDEKELYENSTDIYLGKLEELESGFELIFRYFFAKRQQYQKMCVDSNDPRDFSKDDFLSIKQAYDKSPITGKGTYKPYKNGLVGYLLNYNKVEAILFTYEQLAQILGIIDSDRTYKNTSFMGQFKALKSLNNLKRTEDKIMNFMGRLLEDEKYRNRLISRYQKNYSFICDEIEFLEELTNKMLSKDPNTDKRYALLCMHEDVWKNLNALQRMIAVSVCNEFIEEVLRCESSHSVEFLDGENCFDFEDSDCIFVGDPMKQSSYDILKTLIYAQSFNKNKENIQKLSDEGKEEMLDEYMLCEEKFKESKQYSSIKDYHFIKCVRKTADELLRNCYKYISNNLKIGGKKIPVKITKEEFVQDMYSDKKQRR